MLDFVIAVDDPVTWHTMNLLQNRKHYSILKLLGPTMISSIQNEHGASVYYNTLVPVDGRVNVYFTCLHVLHHHTSYSCVHYSIYAEISVLCFHVFYSVIVCHIVCFHSYSWSDMSVCLFLDGAAEIRTLVLSDNTEGQDLGSILQIITRGQSGCFGFTIQKLSSHPT